MEFGLAFSDYRDAAAVRLEQVNIEWQLRTVKPESQVVEAICGDGHIRLKPGAGWCFHVGFFLLVQRQISRYR